VDLPVFCDWEGLSYEWNKSQGIEILPSQLQEMTEAYCRRLIERGYKAGVYLSKNFWDNWYGQDYFKVHPDFYIWYARPGYSTPDRDCYLWQYACDEGAEYGADEPLDKNILFGDYIKHDFAVNCKNCEALKAEMVRMEKQLAELKADAMRCSGMHSTRRIRRLTGRRNRILKDLMHKASRKVADWAEENKVDIVVLGHNNFQKQGITTGHVNNQTFVQIPFCVFAGMLKYKLEERGIAFLETEESYTSKADFLAGDLMPVYGKEKETCEGKQVTFSGKRIRRGLYLHWDGTKSNADINGAANILRKVIPNGTGWDRGVVDTPYAVKIA
jgi:IS605 OrfB family transposase